MRLGVFAFIYLYCITATAVTIPRDLDAQDRVEVVRILGQETSGKILSNPFPLGGYSGFEVGISMEMINTSDLVKLGCAPGSPGCTNQESNEDEMRYARLSAGKGLYNNLDVFLHFVPLTTGSDLSSFGATARYSFIEAEFLPVNVSLLINGHHVNVNDDFQCLSFGADVVAGIYVDRLSLYMGLGQTHSAGTFVGGLSADGTVDSGDPQLSAQTNTVTTRVTENHSFAGLTLHFDHLFIAAQIDRYRDPTYSARVGLRF